MNRSQLPLIHPSIEYLLRQQLILEIGSNHNIIPKIIFYRSKNEQTILYRCPLTYHFIPSHHAEILAYLDIASLLPFTLTNDGWLEFSLDNQSLSRWLHQLPRLMDEFFPYHPPQTPRAKFNFLWQYTHARCDILSRLGKREGIIAEKPVIFPENEQFSFSHPSEQALILQLLTVVDRWDTANPETLTTHLCESILDFERYCQIMEKSSILVRKRFGLLQVGQLILRSLLSLKLNLQPMTEL